MYGEDKTVQVIDRNIRYQRSYSLYLGLLDFTKHRGNSICGMKNSIIALTCKRVFEEITAKE
jgi:hypothetical protein